MVFIASVKSMSFNGRTLSDGVVNKLLPNDRMGPNDASRAKPVKSLLEYPCVFCANNDISEEESECWQDRSKY
jgi:hypothetical protein